MNTPPSAPVCPTVTENAAPGQTLAVVSYGTIVCADDQQGSIVAACTQPSGSSFPIGQSQVSCTCVDNGGLTNGCTFNVVVQGNSSSLFSLCIMNPVEDNKGDQITYIYLSHEVSTVEFNLQCKNVLCLKGNVIK